MSKTKRIAMYGIMIALAMVLSYVEALVPLSVAVPGVKIGLTNIVVVFALYKMGWKDAAVISIVRVALVGLTFGNAFSMIYGLAGAAMSIAVMALLSKTDKFSQIGVSVAGGVMHNAGQILVAVIVTETAGVAYYLPVLCISGVVAGICVGVVSGLLVRRINIDGLV